MRMEHRTGDLFQQIYAGRPAGPHEHQTCRAARIIDGHNRSYSMGDKYLPQNMASNAATRWAKHSVRKTFSVGRQAIVLDRVAHLARFTAALHACAQVRFQLDM